MESPNISQEELAKFLPLSVIQDMLGSQPPISPLKASPLSQGLPKLDISDSPQIPPLESRLHEYLLGYSSLSRDRCQLNLTDIFNTMELQDEIAQEISKMDEEVSIFSALEKDQVFEQAEKEIQMFLKTN